MKVDRITLTVTDDQATAVISATSMTPDGGTRRTTFQVVGELAEPVQAGIGVSSALGGPPDLNKFVAQLFGGKTDPPAGVFTVKAIFGRVASYHRDQIDTPAADTPEADAGMIARTTPRGTAIVTHPEPRIVVTRPDRLQ